MTEYRIITRQVLEREYVYPLQLPVDMGASSDRLLDRMVRQVAGQGSIDTSGLEQIGTTGESEEEITYVFRDEVQVWPRIRKKQPVEKKVGGWKTKQTIIDDVPGPEFPGTDEG